MPEALALAQQLPQPFNLAWALSFAADSITFAGKGKQSKSRQKLRLHSPASTGFPYWLAVGTILRGWALAEHGKRAEGISQMRQGLAAHRATGSSLDQPYYLACWLKRMGKQGRQKTDFR